MKNILYSSQLHVKNKPVSILISIFFTSLFTISCSDNITPQTIITEEQKVNAIKKEDFISVKPLLLNKKSELITSLKIDTVNIQLPNFKEKIKNYYTNFRLTVFYQDTLKEAFDSETKINDNSILPFEMRFIKSGRYFFRLTCFFYNYKGELEKYTFADIPVFINKNEKEESSIPVFWQKGDIYRNVVWGIGFDEKKKYKLIFSNDFISKPFEVPLTYVAENELLVSSIEKIDPNQYTVSLIERSNLIGFQEAILRDDFSQFGAGLLRWWDSEIQELTTRQLSKIKLSKGEYISDGSILGANQERLKLKNTVTNKIYIIEPECTMTSPPSYYTYKYVFPDVLEEGRYELLKEKIFYNNNVVDWKPSFPYSRIINFVK